MSVQTSQNEVENAKQTGHVNIQGQETPETKPHGSSNGHGINKRLAFKDDESDEPVKKKTRAAKLEQDNKEKALVNQNVFFVDGGTGSGMLYANELVNLTRAGGRHLMKGAEVLMKGGDILQGEMMQGDGFLMSLREHRSKRILETASAGLLLRGIFVTDRREDKMKRREIVLESPNDVVLRGPDINEELKVIKYSSKEAIEKFSETQRSMWLGGKWGVTAEGLGAEIGFNVEKNNLSNVHSITDSSSYSVGVHSVVPIKSAQLNPKFLRFSKSALSDLKFIEQIVTEKSNNDCKTTNDAINVCEQFFHKYGSHVYTGMVHFGGMYNLIAMQRDDSTSLKHESNIYHAVTAEASLRGLPVPGSIQLGFSKENSKSTQNSEQVDLKYSNFDFKEVYQGGYFCKNYEQWKNGLVSNEETWRVIDLNPLDEECLTGIWEIIRHNSSEFKRAEDLRYLMKENWNILLKKYK